MKSLNGAIFILMSLVATSAMSETQVQVPKSCCEEPQRKSSPKTSLLSAAQEAKANPPTAPLKDSKNTK